MIDCCGMWKMELVSFEALQVLFLIREELGQLLQNH